MNKAPAFWDTSALVPMCVLQADTQESLSLYSSYSAIVWWGTHVEMISALTRLRRQLEITPDVYQEAKAEAAKHAAVWRVVLPSFQVARDARHLLETYPLRVADALQLAAALSCCQHDPKGKRFVSFDKRLRDSAAKAGFQLA